MQFPSRLLVVSLSGWLIGCGARVPAPAATPPPSPVHTIPVQPFVGVPAAPEVAVVPDRITGLIANAEQRFQEGRAEWERGRFAAAREHFDAAIEFMLSLPEGARGEPRLQTQFEQLLDRISALELLGLRDADGLTESRSEPAAIDELLSAGIDRPAPAATTAEIVAAGLERTKYDLPITVNSKVLSYVELFQGRLRDFMQAGLDRGQRYLPMIQNVFKSEGLPLDLAYVPLVESAFKNNALSRVSARGMWQFMLGTGLEHGLDHTWFVDERADPEKATRAAAQYLKTLNRMFDGDWYFALASYNAGPGRLQGAVRRSKTDDYWEITASSRYLPRETREYVPMILAAILIAKNPTLYGFEVGASAPLAYETVSVPGALPLATIAEWVDLEVGHLQDLNPELRRTTTPMTTHELKVPVGTAATIQERLTRLDASEYRTFRFHTVKRGETLTTIARRYGLTSQQLRDANELRITKVTRNQTLMIPQRPASALPSASASRPTSMARPMASAGASSSSGAQTYRVRQGDTLSSIARQFRTTIGDLRRLNQLSSDRIKIGDRLTVRR
jgi:membrane-bound lytic murein transglycosylase D